MNPLDKEELKAFLKIVEKDMPIHTDKIAKIKRSYSQGMPKNIKEYSDKVDNKFLNDNLHTIEEMEYRKKGITDDFKNYQHKYYDESGILNHDLYFKHDDKIYAKVSGGSFFNQNAISFSNASLNRKVNGTQLTTVDTVNSTNIAEVSYILASQLSTSGTVGHYYDRITMNVIGTPTGNVRMALYDNFTSSPKNLVVESSSSAAVTSANVLSITESALTTTSSWLAFQASGSFVNNTSTTTPPSSGFRYYFAQAYGVFTNPFSGATTSTTDELLISHS